MSGLAMLIVTAMLGFMDTLKKKIWVLPLWAWIAIGVGVLLLIIIIAVLATPKKKKPQRRRPPAKKGKKVVKKKVKRPNNNSELIRSKADADIARARAERAPHGQRHVHRARYLQHRDDC